VIRAWWHCSRSSQDRTDVEHLQPILQGRIDAVEGGAYAVPHVIHRRVVTIAELPSHPGVAATLGGGEVVPLGLQPGQRDLGIAATPCGVLEPP
jgi:hypothetical protein